MNQKQKLDMPVLIVGAGPVGLTMACELRRYGIDCRIIDKNASVVHESRALGLMARSLEVLSDMGIVDTVLEQGKILHGVNAYADGHRIAHLEIQLDSMDTPYPYLLVLPQYKTEALLTELLSQRGGQVERQTELVAFTQNKEGVTATLRHAQGEEQVRSQWLIGCDGASSLVRHGLKLPFEGSDYEETFLLADVQIDWDLPADQLHIFLTPEGTVVAFPYPTAGRWRIVNTHGEGQSTEPEQVVQHFQEKLHANGAAGAAVSAPTWVSAFHFHRRMVPHLRRGRCFLAGDAAHIHSPANGQGLNTGIQDAYKLAWKLSLVIAGAAHESLLDSYEAERLPVARAVLNGSSDLTTKAVTLRNPVAKRIRNQLLSFLFNQDFIQRQASQGVSELGLNYRHSPIVMETRQPLPQFQLLPHPAFAASPLDYLDFGAAPRPGDRAPDVMLNAAATNHLFDVLQGTQHTLLLFTGTHLHQADVSQFETIKTCIQADYAPWIQPYLVVATAESVEQTVWNNALLLDPAWALHHRYGAGSACLYLIRPDGYIGYRSQPISSDNLFAYLKQVFR